MGLTYLLIAIICGIVGYFIGKSTIKSFEVEDNKYKSDLDACNRRNVELQHEITTLKTEISQSDSQKTNVVSQTTKTSKPAIIVFNPDVAKAVFGKKIKENDLKIVEGIGPKIEELFKTSGILSWKALGETSVDRCNKILHKAGDRYRIHDAGTWPKQAKLAYQGKWQKLKDWQDQLDKGKVK